MNKLKEFYFSQTNLEFFPKRACYTNALSPDIIHEKIQYNIFIVWTFINLKNKVERNAYNKQKNIFFVQSGGVFLKLLFSSFDLFVQHNKFNISFGGNKKNLFVKRAI